MDDKIPMTQGDLEPTIRGQLTENDEVTPIPITGLAFNLHIEKPTGVLTKVAVIVDELNGIYEFPWEAGETDEAGSFPAEIEIIYPGNRPLTLPPFVIHFRVEKG